MTDIATPNLPSRDFDTTLSFYTPLGFECGWRDEGWMILKRGAVVLEFFPHAELDPTQSWFSCCIRLDDLAAMAKTIRTAGLPEHKSDFPRFQSPDKEASGLEIAYLVDPDGTLIRLIQHD